MEDREQRYCPISKSKINSCDFNFCEKTFLRKISTLITHKSFVEVILSQIKNAQLNFLNEKKCILNLNKLESSGNSKNNKNITIKSILNGIKENLLSIYENQINTKKYLESLVSNKKEIMQNLLYSEKNNNNNFYSVSNEFKVEENKKSETEYLKSLNFKSENEINYLDFITDIKINQIIEMKSINFIQENDREIFPENKKNKSIAINIFKTKIEKAKEKLISILSKKIKRDFEINRIKNLIERAKNYLIEINNEKKIINENYDESISRKSSRSYNKKAKNTKKVAIKRKSNATAKNKNINNNNDFKLTRSLSYKTDTKSKHKKNSFNLNVNLSLSIKNINIYNNYPKKIHSGKITKHFNEIKNETQDKEVEIEFDENDSEENNNMENNSNFSDDNENSDEEKEEEEEEYSQEEKNEEYIRRNILNNYNKENLKNNKIANLINSKLQNYILSNVKSEFNDNNSSNDESYSMSIEKNYTNVYKI